MHVSKTPLLITGAEPAHPPGDRGAGCRQWEDDWAVRREPLRLGAPAVWCAAALLAATTAWLKFQGL